MAKKVIIVSRGLIRKNKRVGWVSEIYASILCKHNVLPIIIPIAKETLQVLPHYLCDYDGILMVEGGDVNPSLYNCAYPNPEELDTVKDEIETTCFTHAYQHNKSIMGFCRGLHIINVMLGGTLYKDVNEGNEKVKHIDYNNYDDFRHTITIKPNTPLCEWYAQEQIQVNSYHHQGIENIGKGLMPMATSADGLIEAVYEPSHKFLVGLQFHPERMLTEYEGNTKVFDAFINSL